MHPLPRSLSCFFSCFCHLKHCEISHQWRQNPYQIWSPAPFLFPLILSFYFIRIDLFQALLHRSGRYNDQNFSFLFNTETSSIVSWLLLFISFFSFNFLCSIVLILFAYAFLTLIVSPLFPHPLSPHHLPLPFLHGHVSSPHFLFSCSLSSPPDWVSLLRAPSRDIRSIWSSWMSKCESCSIQPYGR